MKHQLAAVIENRMWKTTEKEFTAYPREFRQDLQKIVEILRSYKVNKILLYGSLARGDSGKGSDIDICVEGLAEENFFLAYADCLFSAQHSVSIVDLESTHGYFQQNILKDGVILYAAK